MTTKIQAIYERGVFRPTDPVALSEGTAVELTVNSGRAKNPSTNIAAVLAEIASLPPEGKDDGFSGADHDQVLYPKKGAV